jgi:hypothetical protein
MKKIFTLFAGLFMTIALFAADRRPVVTVKKEMNYKVVIDGRTYFDNDMIMKLNNLSYGRHSIRVYEINRRGFFSRERLVASTTFRLDNDDLRIKIDRFGKIEIREKKNYGRFERDNKGWNDEDWNDRDDRDYRDNGRDRNRF